MGPTLEETAAVIFAVDAYSRKMHPRKPRPISELPRMLDELAEVLDRMRSVTEGCQRKEAP